MLDFSWSEFLIVLVVAVLAIGPKQIPDVLYTLGRLVRRLQYMRFALGKQFEDFMQDSDLNEMRKISDHVHSVKSTVEDETEHDMDLHTETSIENENPAPREDGGDHGTK